MADPHPNNPSKWFLRPTVRTIPGHFSKHRQWRNTPTTYGTRLVTHPSCDTMTLTLRCAQAAVSIDLTECLLVFTANRIMFEED